MRRICGEREKAMYRCELCGREFEAPLVRETTEERPDGFYERFCEVLCPWCGGAYWHEEEADDP